MQNPALVFPSAGPLDSEPPKGKWSDTRFFKYLQEHRNIVGKECPKFPERCEPKDPLRQDTIHTCINLQDADVLDYAGEFYNQQRTRDDCAFSVKVVDVLRWMIFGVMVIVIPLDIFVLLRWTLPRTLNKFSRDSREQRSLFPPYEWSLKVSLWIIFVPHAKLAALGGLRAALYLQVYVPSFQHSHSSNIEEGRKMIEVRAKRLETLKALYNDWREEESEALRRLHELKADASLKDRWEIDEWRRKATSTWQRITFDCKNLGEQIGALKAEISEIREIARTQTSEQITGYKGVSDWAKDALDTYMDTITAVSAVSVLGAGLSYTSIVSASRGNISYMFCSFALFMICLVIATSVQVILTWYSHRANYPLRNPRLWEISLVVAVYGAGMSMTVAIIFLLVTVQSLDSDPTHPPVVTFSPMASVYVTYAVSFL
ncbi:uncharacterized protein EI90DRAFT_1401894 [Cantharellus anzutake]|uniref:uncharacterized protein n=1 Tax=Cantharellus anzutake TaxID=1750568 RepID=UPI0019054321|nr:uncharacterized protein EI90DRAFT_1401894 [Cantharellus anzutake]KAF8329468.1 hypothetical protein EI90DRAFT_1401894 [Cantharellus anzutake]